MVKRMGQERFEQLAAVFEHARELEPDARRVYLDQACADEPELRAQVIALLDRHDHGGLLDDPIRAADASQEPIPQRIGRFRVLERLGRGGMGVVYRAEQDQPQRQVALKMMHAGLFTDELRRRFEFETSVLARLQHPGIAQIYEVGTWDAGSGPRPFFAMELVDGVALDNFIAQAKPSIETRLRLFIAICDAVQHAHQKGVIHRDLKPANILVTVDGAPKILDFGVARATDADVQATLYTTPGQLVGTLAYMSPEQVGLATDRLDTRSDVYALGVILYELLAGQLPYDLGGVKIASAIRVIEESEPRSLTTVSRNLGGDLETIVRKALRKRPENRYQSASDLAADLVRFLEHQPIVARPATALYQLNRFARRHRGLVVGLAVALLALIVGAVGVAWQGSLARTEARTRREVADFLHEMLTSIDPAKTAGKPLTVREMLDDAAARLDDRFENAQLVRGELHHTVGSTYAQLGAYEDAQLHARSAVADLEATSGPRAESTLLAMATLGSTLSQLDRLEEAETILREALQRVSTPDGPVADSIREHLAIVLDDRGRDAEAQRLFRDVYERALDRLGAGHIDTLRAQNNLGKLLMESRRFDEALPHLMECLERRRAVLGDDHPHTIITIANLGALYNNMGRTDEATALAREAAERSERVLGSVHLSSLRRRQNLVRSEITQGNFDAAVSQARGLLTVCERELGASHSETLAALELTVTAVALGGDMDAAETLALDSYERIEAELGPTHRATGRVAWLLQNLYEEMGKSDEEAAWRRRVEASSFLPGGASHD